MTALVTGSMTPDFEYFIRMRNLSLYSHNWSGLLWFDLPLAFILTFIYHYFVRDGLINNLPQFARRKLVKYTDFNWAGYVKQHFLVVVVCLCIGITTHIIWDGFTHPNGYFVGIIPWLKYNIDVFGIEHTRFHVLQVISSFMGGTAVLYAILKIPGDATVPKKKNGRYWLVVLCIIIMVVSLRILSGITLKMTLDLIMTAFSGFFIGLVLAPFIIRNRA